MFKTIYYCDRCGKEIKKRHILNRTIKYWAGEYNYFANCKAEYELCEDCNSKIVNFIKNKSSLESESNEEI